MKIPVPDTNQPAVDGRKKPSAAAVLMGGLTLKIQAGSVPEALRKSKRLLKKQAGSALKLVKKS